MSSRLVRGRPLLDPGLELLPSSRPPNASAEPLLEPTRRDMTCASGAVLELGLRQSVPGAPPCRSIEGRNDTELLSRGRGGGWNMNGDALFVGLVRNSELSVCNLDAASMSRAPYEELSFGRSMIELDNSYAEPRR